MKKTILLFLLASLLSPVTHAQKYLFSKSNAVYTDLQNPNIVSGNLIWDEEKFTVPIGFNFRFLGRTVTQLSADGNGFIDFSFDTAKLVFIAFGADMASKGTLSSLSPISYLLEGSAGNRILKIEYKNATFFNDTITSTVNFQVWIHEVHNAIELHMGSSNVVNTALAYDGKTGPACGVFYPDSGLTTFIYSLGLSGNPASPQAKAMNISSPEVLDATPLAGTVYRFEPEIGVGIPALPSAGKQKLHVYPNPAGNDLYIVTPEKTTEPLEMGLYNLNGQCVQRLQGAEHSAMQLIHCSIDRSALVPGVYLLKVQGGHIQEIHKVVLY